MRKTKLIVPSWLRKPFLLVFALCATMMAWGANGTITIDETFMADHPELKKSQDPNYYPFSFTISNVITVSPELNAEGTGFADPYTGSYVTGWRCWASHNNGKFFISCPEQYWITQITATFKGQLTGPIGAVTSGVAYTMGNDGGNMVWFSVPSGTTTITSIKVWWIEAPKGITLTETEAELTVGETKTLTYTTNPEKLNEFCNRITWKSDNESVATIEDGVITAKAAGTAHITVSTVNKKTATCTVTVKPSELPTPTFTIEDITASMYDATATPNPVVKIGDEEQTGAVITYASSDENIVKVVDNKLTILAAGEVTITADLAASDTYTAAQTEFTVTVTGGLAADETITEGYTNAPTYTGWNSSSATFDGDNTPYKWEVLYFRHGLNDECKVNGKDGIYLAQAPLENHLSATIEGGIKAIAFDWKVGPKKTAITTELYYDNVKVGGIAYTGKTAGDLGHYEAAWKKPSNKEFKLINAGDGTVYGPITITPYLLYTKKSDDLTILASEAQATYKNESIINNTGATPTFSIVSSAPTAIATIATDGTVTATAAGTIKVQAAWEDVTTTYTLNIAKNTLPVPTLSFADGNEVSKDMNDNGYVNALTNPGDGEETYESSDETVATVDAKGEITVIGEGTTTITVTVAACATYAGAEASYVLTITDPEEDAVWERFSAYTGEGKWTWTAAGTDYELTEADLCTWNTHYARRQKDDKLTSGDNATWMSVVSDAAGYLTTSNLEGGVKRIAFAWNQQIDNNGTSVGVDIYVGDEKVAGVSRAHVAEIGEDYQFNQNIFSKSSNLTIKNASVGGNGRVLVGDMKITPYLLFKKKTFEYKYSETQSIDLSTIVYDNTGATPSYTVMSGSAILSDDGKTLVFAENVEDEISVKAEWEEVSTTTTIMVHTLPTPTITFNDFDVDLDGTVTPDITVKVNEEDITETATISYEVADENIATWDATNGWKLKTNGATQVTAKVEGTAQYGAASATATMTVNTITFAEGTFFTENFGGEATGKYSTDKENWRGKDNVYPWTFLNWRRYTDNIRITMTKTDDVTTNGYIYMNPFDDGALEGGIKAVQVTWNAPGASSLATDFYVDDMNNSTATKVTVKKEAGAITGQQITQAIFNSKKNNAQLRIRIGSLDKSAIGVYSVDIVPYLLYTQKKVEVTLEDAEVTYKNENLIDNRDNEVAISYSVDNGASIATDGTVTATAAGEYTVTAAWGDVSTTYTLNVTITEPDFILENKTAGAYATICLPNKIDHVENATLYSINYGTTQEIEFVEADLANDEAGMPYLVQVAEDGDVNFYYGEGDAVTEPVDAETAKGFVGSLQEAEQEIPSDGTAILISGGQLRIAGVYCVLTKNHAYIDATNLPDSPTQSVGQRRTLRLYNAEVTTPTALENGIINKTQCTKIVVNGRFIIMRNAHTYSAQGMLIK